MTIRADAVPPELHELVLKRDRVCFLARLDRTHSCSDQRGRHSCADQRRLTVDHVHEGYGMMGKRAPSDKEHLVTLCWSENVRGPSSATREAQRAYLSALYPEVWGSS